MFQQRKSRNISSRKEGNQIPSQLSTVVDRHTYNDWKKEDGTKNEHKKQIDTVIHDRERKLNIQSRTQTVRIIITRSVSHRLRLRLRHVYRVVEASSSTSTSTSTATRIHNTHRRDVT
mmetsp:Transcript_26280/g.30278  ORF Transcript_26280/g.30278 Transcript_26280/m.30278 type:complete len:118 (-) Transcript_26280:30-383(-)